MQRMQRRGFDKEEIRACEALHVIMRLRNVNDTELAELVGFSTQQVQKRHKGVTRIRPAEYGMFAAALRVPEEVFRYDPPDILVWFADRFELVGGGRLELPTSSVWTRAFSHAA